MTSTEQYIKVLTNLKSGDLGLLRTHGGQGLDESVDGFDLFAGLWWPLRAKNQRAPRRKVAWLVAKLYAACPIEHSHGEALASQIRRCQPKEEEAGKRFRRKFDEMLALPLGENEPYLRWALGVIASKNMKLDWVQLTNDLSLWERESTRLEWAKQFLNSYKGGQ